MVAEHIIRVSYETKEKLDSMKNHKRETYDDLLQRHIKIIEGMQLK